MTLHWILDRGSWLSLLHDLSAAEVVAFDLETTGRDAREEGAAIVMAQFSTDKGDWVLPLFHPESPWQGRWKDLAEKLARFLLTFKVKLVTQNGKFDGGWLSYHSGVDMSELLWWDTMVAGHLMDENGSHGLEDMAKRYLGMSPWSKKEMHAAFNKPGGALNVSLSELGVYGALDTRATLGLYHYQQQAMFLRGEEPLTEEDWQMYGLGRLAQEVSMPSVRSLCRVEQQGMRVDRETVEETLQSAIRSGRESLQAMVDLYPYLPGEPSVHATSKWFTAWTERCASDGHLRVTSYTPGGRPQWNAAALKRNARSGSLAADYVLKARDGLKSAEFLSKWLELSGRDGRIYPTFNVGKVSTGRLSSEQPNAQQIARKLKGCFYPSEGYALMEADYSQLEVRLAAHIAHSDSLAEAYSRGLDIHRETAAAIVGKPGEEVTDEERSRAKAAVF